MAAPNPAPLSSSQIDHFMRHSYLRLESCFTPSQAADWTSQVWTRLGFDPADKSTWTRERTNMPKHRTMRVSSFAPAAWAGICELLGGEERVEPGSDSWNDAFIVNLGSEEFEGREVDPKTLTGWHVDGDIFVHFLDSPEQALLVIPLFTDIREGAGGTVLCTDGVAEVAKHLYNHPEGVDPHMNPVGQPKQYDELQFFNELVQSRIEFHEMTGCAGDVILLHPLMLHSASRNSLRLPRIITNPPVALRAPFELDRADPREYSIVERKTLQYLGVERLEGWKIRGERQRIVPERVRIQEEMKKEEQRRLESLETAQVTDGAHRSPGIAVEVQ